MKLYVVFTLGSAEYALPVELVLQMESFNGATLVPGAPAYVAGIVTVRGQVVPVVDLRVRFGLPAVEDSLDTRIIVTKSEGRVVALRVDSAREVLKLDVDKHQPAPGVLSERAQGFVEAIHVLGQRLLQIVNLPQILNENHVTAPLLLPDDASTSRQLPG